MIHYNIAHYKWRRRWGIGGSRGSRSLSIWVGIRAASGSNNFNNY